MKIKMTTTAILDKGRYYHNYIYEVGCGISKDLAEKFIKCNYAVIEEDPQIEKEVEKPKAPTTKKKTTKGKKIED